MTRTRLSTVGIFVGLVALGALVLWLRSPDALRNPVFYTEDGTWTGQALSSGWWHTAWSAKDGYLVVGNVLLLWWSTWMSEVVCGSPVACVPEAIAWTSYAFFAVVASVAFLVTRGVIPWFGAVLLYAGLLLLPYGLSTNEILGRVSNTGYSLSLLAAWLVFARQRTRSRLRPGLDALLVLCAATNPVVIPVVLLVLVLGWGGPDDGERALHWPAMRHRVRRGLPLVIGLAVVSVLVVIRMVNATGPNRTGTLEPATLIEVGVARSLLYPLVWLVYGHLTDVLVIAVALVLLALVVASATRITSGPARGLLSVLTLALALTWASTMWSRPSLTQQLSGYTTTFPDRYFMGMNQLVFAVLVVVFAALAAQTGADRVGGILALVVIAALVAVGIPRINESDKTEWPIAYGFDWREQICLQDALVGPADTSTTIPVYYEGWVMTLPSETVREAASAIGCEDEFPVARGGVPDWFAPDSAALVPATMINDDTWRNGFSKQGPAFLAPNSEQFRAAFAPGAPIRLPDGTDRVVEAVRVEGQLLVVEYSGKRFRPSARQYPLEITAG